MHAETSSPSMPAAPLMIGDAAGFESLYRDNVRFVWRNLSRLGVAQDELEDVCQEVFVTVHRAQSRFEGRSGVRSWLYGILRRVAWRHRRSFDRRRRRHEAYGALPQSELAEPAVARQLLAAKLQQFLDELDPDKREAFVLAELEELTAGEISERVGANPNTIYSRLRAARLAFEARFGPLPRQRESVRAAHRSDAPTKEQKQRGWMALVGLPMGPAAAAPGGDAAAAKGTAAAKTAVSGKMLAGVAVAAASIAALLVVAFAPSPQAAAVFDRSAGGVVGRLQAPPAPVFDGLLGVAETSAPILSANAGQLASAGVLPVAQEGWGAAQPGRTDKPGDSAPLAQEGRGLAPATSRRPASPASRGAPGGPTSTAGPADAGGPPTSVPHARDGLSRSRPPTVGGPPDNVPPAVPGPATSRPAAPATRDASGSLPARGDGDDTPRASPKKPRAARDRGAKERRAPKSEHAEDVDSRKFLSAQEIALLRSARRALEANDPKRALSRLREHARRFPDSDLAVERSASTAEAFCASGRQRSARPHLRRLERAGQSRLAARIRKRCGS